MPVDYCIITQAKERLQFQGFILSRGVPFLPCTLALSKKLKMRFEVHLNSICEVDLSDFDKKVGDGDILSLVNTPKELKQLTRAGIIPEESEYSYLCNRKTNDDEDAVDETEEDNAKDDACHTRAKGKREAANAQKASRSQGKKGSGLSPQLPPTNSPSLNFQLQKLDEQMGDCALTDL
jgi:hypothetical protein